MDLGYVAELERTGSDGFLAAAESADVELILVSYDLHYGDWKLTDTLANLQADARTKGVPLFVYGPLRRPVHAAQPRARLPRDPVPGATDRPGRAREGS